VTTKMFLFSIFQNRVWPQLPGVGSADWSTSSSLQSECLHVGDDIVDLPLLKRVGLAIAVGNAHPLLRPHVHYWTKRDGGLGAVREAIELILTAQGKWAAIAKEYLG